MIKNSGVLFHYLTFFIVVVDGHLINIIIITHSAYERYLGASRATSHNFHYQHKIFRRCFTPRLMITVVAQSNGTGSISALDLQKQTLREVSNDDLHQLTICKRSNEIVY